MWIELAKQDWYRLEDIANVWKSAAGQWLCFMRGHSPEITKTIAEETARLILGDAFPPEKEER